jgi:hypothetical protein
MRTYATSLLPASAFLALSLAASGCSVKATIQQTTDTTSNMTGTTSSAHSWVSEDGQLNQEFKAIAFVSVNQTNLHHDMAKGEGEYLTSLGTLLGIPPNEQRAYGSAVQARYAHDLDGLHDSPAAWLALLQDMAQPYRRTATAFHLDHP